MKKLNAIWIVLIVFSSLIVLGGIFYLFYRLYINHIYKRKRYWNEITSSLKSEEIINENIISLMPRQSVIPLIQEYLPNEFKKQFQQRKMVTKLQFNEPPVFVNNFNEQWNEMDTKSLFSIQLISNQTSYNTITGQISCIESKPDEESYEKYFSITSSDELITPPTSFETLSLNNNNSEKQSSLQIFFNPFTNSFRSLNYNKNNNSSNSIVLYMEQVQKINISNNVLNI